MNITLLDVIKTYLLSVCVRCFECCQNVNEPTFIIKSNKNQRCKEKDQQIEWKMGMGRVRPFAKKNYFHTKFATLLDILSVRVHFFFFDFFFSSSQMSTYCLGRIANTQQRLDL